MGYALVLTVLIGFSRAININVASSGGNKTSGLQYGLMFEDINHSGDGGLYAELIQNRAFQGSVDYPSTISPWTPVNGASLTLSNLSVPLSSALPTSLHVTAANGSSGPIGFANPGWWGIDVKSQAYTGSFYVKGDYSGSFTASLQSDTGEVYGSATIPSQASSSEWVQYNFTLTPKDAPNVNNTFSITFDPTGVSGGALDFNLISLFPPTYKGTPNGNRVDLMELLANLKPSFLRLPGGNNLEGNDPPYFWNWSATVGPLKDRPGRPGTWGYENTDGLDLGVEPILAVWAGYYLDGTYLANSSMPPYVESVMNELEFLMGDTSTTYGAVRASLGYPNPWVINYVEVGNEDNLGDAGSSYESYRFDDFYYPIHAKYPWITILPSTVAYDNVLPGNGTGDYHQYTRPDMFVSQFNYFDNFPTDRWTLLGEYAAVQPNEAGQAGVDWSAPRWSFPMWVGTVSEAVYLLGAERNADHIVGASYAPLLQNLDNFEWDPDLIGFTSDPSQDVMSTSYHLVQLYSGTRISETLPAPATDGTFGPLYWVAGKGATGSYILKTAVYNSTELTNSTEPYPVNVNFDGVGAGASGTLTLLTAPGPYSYNDIGSDIVKTTTTQVTANSNGTFEFQLPDYSIALFEVQAGGGSGKRWNRFGK